MAIGGLGNLNQINRTNSAVGSSIQKIATGSRNPSAKNGVSAYSISARMSSNVGTAAQSQRNTQNANAMLNVAAGGVSSTVNALTNIKEQILQAANGTNKDSDVATIRNSIQKSVSTINDNASVEYNGMKLLDGSRSITVAGDTGYKTVNLKNMSSEGLGLTDAQGKLTLDLSSPDGIKSSLETVDNALDSALGLATDIGAAQQGLSSSEANYTTMGESLTASLSTEDDTDIAAEITKLRSAEAQNQLALHAQKMFMHNSAQVLSLLP
jgi:flagellin